MIILEFRFHQHFHQVCRLLENHGIPFEFETAREEWRPSLVWLFEEHVEEEGRSVVLRQARSLEALDHFQQRHAAVLNLAVPQ